MIGFALKRLAWTVFDLLVIVTIAFVLSYLIPGDPARTIAGPHASAETVMRIRHQLGLDEPLVVQYARYLNQVIHLQFGTSIEYGTPVINAIWSRFGPTVELALAGLVFEVLLGVPLGVFAALSRGRWFDRISGMLGLAAVSVPQFWLGIMLLFLFAFKWGLFPLGGYGQPVLWYVFLPGLTLGIGGAAYYSQLVKTRVLDLLDRPFIQAARARGVSETSVMIRHVMPNVMTTLITQMGMDLGYFMAGVVVVETVFGWPGIGLQAWSAIQALDVPLIVGTVVFGAFWVVIANLIVDFLYGLFDPRIRTGS
ncbi:MAG: ABC transporter permease [Alicyclobacillus sp.]|nr:ABC transporter permease [Alicyclobacillus sp.]